MLISGAAGALSGALGFSTANLGVLVGGNAVINMGAYCVTQKVHGEDISIAGMIISGGIGGVAGLIGGSSKNVTDLAKSALRYSQLSIMASEGGKETLDYILTSVIAGMGRSFAVEVGRYITTNEIIAVYNKVVCGE